MTDRVLSPSPNKSLLSSVSQMCLILSGSVCQGVCCWSRARVYSSACAFFVKKQMRMRSRSRVIALLNLIPSSHKSLLNFLSLIFALYNKLSWFHFIEMSLSWWVWVFEHLHPIYYLCKLGGNLVLFYVRFIRLQNLQKRQYLICPSVFGGLLSSKRSNQMLINGGGVWMQTIIDLTFSQNKQFKGISYIHLKAGLVFNLSIQSSCT